MFTQPNALKINANALRLFNVFSILTTMFVFTSQAKAGYSVLGGAPVSQGRMIISEVDFEEIKKQDPTAKPSFALKETRVEADISGVLARVRVSQVFRNPFSNPMEAVYLFPLPENSAVDAYSFQIGERLIVGEVKARAEARQEYQRAKTEGRKAALLEQERANIFTQSVANIPANSEVVIHLEYVQSLEVDEDRYMFRFPMVVAPR
ncbi:VIT domain-containing protein, partial [bacterium]|nr:VIT domain-containing protein [bacterium]